VALGVAIVWEAAPPSDHKTNSYITPPTVCGETTPSIRITPTMLGTATGVAPG
jgi:hypothetical protein